jgi:hypothetical protein
MMFRENGPGSGAGRSAVAIIIVMVLIMTMHGSAVLSQEVADQKPKKPRFEKNDLTLRDNRSGLVWVLNANLAGRQFSWSGTFDGIDLIVNAERYAGFRDWRVPTKEELLTLVELARSQGYDGKPPGSSIITGLASVGFQNVQDDAYWSSSENRYYAAEAWVVDMTAGIAARADKTLYFNLWPVRSAR